MKAWNYALLVTNPADVQVKLKIPATRIHGRQMRRP